MLLPNRPRAAPSRQRTGVPPVVVATGAILIFALLYKMVLHPRPYWAFYFDPETIYFSGGLKLLRGDVGLNLDNPATPVHILSALICFVLGSDPLAIDYFRFAGYLVAVASTLGGVTLLARTVLSDLSFPLQLSALSIYFLHPDALRYSAIWSPEILFLSVGSLALAAIWTAMESEPARGRYFVAGAAIGLCIAVKFTFLPWAAATFGSILLDRRRAGSRLARLAITAGGIGSGFLASTFFVASRYDDMFGWIVRLLSRSGPYGSGKLELPTISGVVERLWLQGAHANAWNLLVAGVGSAFLWVTYRGLRQGGLPWLSKCPGFQPACFGVLAATASYGCLLRTSITRYLLPAGLALIPVVAFVSRVVATSLEHQAARRKLAPGVLVVVAILLSLLVIVDLHKHNKLVSEQWSTQSAINLTIETDWSERGNSKQPVVLAIRREPAPARGLTAARRRGRHQAQVLLRRLDARRRAPRPSPRPRAAARRTGWRRPAAS